MKHHHQEIRREDCPNCGAEEGAFMGSSLWGHNFPCCSDSCGEQIAERINKNTSTWRYRLAMWCLEKSKHHVREQKYKGLPFYSDPFEHINGL